MDPTVILTGVGTVVATVTTNIALIGWLRSDIKGFESELKKDRKDFEIKLEYWQESISRETKDFHGRLCTQEEKIRHTRSSLDKQP